MGGMVFVGIRYRDESGTIKEALMERWTNPLPTWIGYFIADEKEVIDYVKQEREAKDPEKVMDIDYGTILIDMINREIYSRQNYAQPGHFSLSSHSTGSDDEEILVNLLIKKGLIKKIERFTGSKFKEDDLIQPEQFREVLNREKMKDRVNYLYFIQIKDKAMKIDHKQDYPKVRTVKKWLKKNGWTSEVDEESFREDE